MSAPRGAAALGWFLVKAAARRVGELLRLSPVMTLWGLVVIAAFVYAAALDHRAVPLSPETAGLTLAGLTLLPALDAPGSLRLALGRKIFFAKARLTAAGLSRLFFAGRLVFSLAPLGVFWGLYHAGRLAFPGAAPWMAPGSFACAVALAAVVRGAAARFSRGETPGRGGFAPGGRLPGVAPERRSLVASALVDYGFLAAVLSLVSLGAVVLAALFFRNGAAMLRGMREPVFFLIALFLGVTVGAFAGLEAGVGKTNWAFYGIVSLDFGYHLKRALVVVLVCGAPALGVYAGAAIYLGAFRAAPADAVLWILALFLALALALFLAFVALNSVVKFFLYCLGFSRLAMSLLVFQPALMTLTAVPAAVCALLAWRDYKDRALL